MATETKTQVLTVSAGEVLRAAKVLKKVVVAKRNSLPVLGKVRVSCVDGVVRFQATDLDVWATIVVAGDGVEGSEILVDLSTLESVAKAAGKSGSVAVAADSMRGGAMEVECRSDVELAEWPLFPKLVSAAPMTVVKADELAAVAVAATSDGARPVLCSVLVHDNGELAATDSYRLHWRDGVGESTRSEMVAIPAVKAILAAAGPLVCVYGPDAVEGGRHVVLESNGVTIVARNIEGIYPAYRNLIPSSTAGCVIVSGLAAALATLPKVKEVPVRLDFEAGTASIIEHFKAASTTKFVVESDGPVALTAFNSGFLADALKVVGGDSVLLGVVGPTKPMTISGDSAVNALIMPVRIA